MQVFIPFVIASRSTSSITPPKVAFAIGNAHDQNARERPTMFSHIRDCDSWIPSETACAIGVPNFSPSLGNPCSYNPCPHSCIVEPIASGKLSGA